jgi:hypothetical protein
MAQVLIIVVAVVALAGLFLILRNYRRQRDFEEGPGKVPEDYS